jgi:hypothetical protein
MKRARTERAIDEIFAVLSNNAHNIWRVVGYGFYVNAYGRVKTVMCDAIHREVTWPLGGNGLVLCLRSIEHVQGEEGHRIAEAVGKGDEAQDLMPLKLTFTRGEVELIQEIYEEGSYWGDTRIEYIYRITSMPSDDVVAYAVLIPYQTVIPVDTTQLWKTIYDIVTDEEKPIRL